jgi:hypothetical protein
MRRYSPAVTTAPPWLPASDMAELLRVVAETPHADVGGDIVIDVDAARLARQLRHSARTVIGLLPTGPDPQIQPLALQLGFALSTLTQTLTLVLDPEQRAGFTAALAKPESGAFVYTQSAAAGVAILTPFQLAPTGAKFEMVKVLLQFVEERSKSSAHARPYGHVLCDLTGCTRPGELLGAIQLVDGIIVVGRSGLVTEKEIMSAAAGVPRELNLGVLITE